MIPAASQLYSRDFDQLTTFWLIKTTPQKYAKAKRSVVNQYGIPFHSYGFLPLFALTLSIEPKKTHFNEAARLLLVTEVARDGYQPDRVITKSDKGKYMTQENNKTINNKPVGQTSSSSGGGSATQMQKHTGNGEPYSSKSLLEQVKSTAGNAYESATHTATSKLDEQKGNLSTGLSSVADSVRRIGENLQAEAPEGVAKVTAEYSDTVAQKLDQAADYFGNNDLKKMYGDAESFARRNPAVLIGGAFVLGLLAVRFLKSSKSSSANTSSGRNFETTGINSGGFNNTESREQTNHSSR